MFYQEALPKFRLLSRVDSLLTIGDRHWRKKPLLSKKPNQQIHFRLHGNGCLFMWGAYFCMGAYKRDVVVVIKMGTYIHGVLILCGCLLSRFYRMSEEHEVYSVRFHGNICYKPNALIVYVSMETYAISLMLF